jgi:hypothetical protein
MGPGELAKAYLTHYAILTYLALAAVWVAVILAWGTPGRPAVLAAGIPPTAQATG